MSEDSSTKQLSAEKPPASLDRQDKVLPYTGVRKTIGERLKLSVNEKPAVGLVAKVCCDRLMKYRDDLVQSGIKVSFNDMLLFVVSRILCKFPEINSDLRDNEIIQKAAVNVGLAVDTEKGLMVVNAKNTDRMALSEIAETYAQLIRNVKNGVFASADIKGSSFTITNLGGFGIHHFTPIINPGECCILGVGCIERVPAVSESGALYARHEMCLTLAFDHRIIDGVAAAKFLKEVKEFLENPASLFESSAV